MRRHQHHPPPTVCACEEDAVGASSTSASSGEDGGGWPGAPPPRRDDRRRSSLPGKAAAAPSRSLRRPRARPTAPDDDDLATVLAARLASTGLLDGLRAHVRAAAVAALRGGGDGVPDARRPPPSLADALIAQHLAVTGRSLTASVFESEAGVVSPRTAAALAAELGLSAEPPAGRSVLEALCASAQAGRRAGAAADAALAAVRRELGGGGGEGGGGGARPANRAGGDGHAAVALSGEDECVLSPSASSSCPESSGEG